MPIPARMMFLFFFMYHSVTPANSQFQRNVNAVIIESDSLHDYELLKRYAGLIQFSGFDICKMDSATGVLTTHSYFIEKLPILVFYKLMVEGSYAMLSAYLMDFTDYYDPPGKSANDMKWIRVSFRSVQGKEWHACFKKLVALSETLRSGVHGKVTWLEETFATGSASGIRRLEYRQ